MKKTQTQQHLRKRQVVVIGHGLSVISFCQSFRSKFAELTLITDEGNFAPNNVLDAIASQKVSAESFVRSIRIMFSKRKDLKIISQSIASIDPEKREIILNDSDETIHFDYLIIGKEKKVAKNNVFNLGSYTESIRSRKELEQLSNPNIAIIGNGPRAIESAVSFTSISSKTSLINPDEEIFDEKNENTLTRIKYQIRRTGVHLFQNATVCSYDDHQIKVAGQTIPCDLLIDLKTQTIPQVIIDLGFEHENGILLKTKPDGSIPDHARFYALAELRGGKDGLGKRIPEIDAAYIQHAKHLAKIIRGKIEGWKGYDVDTPSFVYSSKGQFIRLHSAMSVGIVKSKCLRGIKATICDSIFHKWPAFKTTYGPLSAFAKLLSWTIARR